MKIGKSPVLSGEETRDLIQSVNTNSLIGLRDRAIIATMLYSFARVSAVCGMKVRDYHSQGRRAFFRFREKGGKLHQVPCHHKAEKFIDEYLQEAGISDELNTPLFRTAKGRTGQLTENGMRREDVFRMIGRRARKAGLNGPLCCHSFRATGITVFLENG